MAEGSFNMDALAAQIAAASGSSTEKEAERYNVGGGVMLTQDQLVNQFLADPHGDDSNLMKQSLVSGRFLDPRNVDDPAYVERALTDAVRVRSAMVSQGNGRTFNSGIPGSNPTEQMPDLWGTTASYSGFSEQRFAPQGGGGGGYSGPVSTVTEMNVEDLKNIANQTAGMLVGRAVSDDEFDKMLKKVRKAEKKDPRITDSSNDGKVSVKEGISTQGKQSIIRDALVNTDEADGVIKATTMMGNFDEWLRSKNG